MAASAAQLSRFARTAKKLEKPRPLKIPSQNRHSTIDTRLGTVEEIMTLTDTVVSHLANGNYDRILQSNIKNLHGVLKTYGSKLEAIYKDQLDRAFVTFRNGCRDELLDYVSRLLLLELIELRATQWAPQEPSSYYKHKLSHIDVDTASTPTLDNAFTPTSIFPPIVVGGMPVPQPLLLGPGELVKSSGKYPAPTKVLGKNYCKDEVVIRNSDSGKVMGIKGRRVHMIEELSETVISFQRVNPGAKERLVQITGPTEEKINYAKQLMEETIRRNASPVRADTEGERMGSSSSLNSSTSDDSLLQGGKRTTLLHSFSTNDATLGEYKYTVTVGDESIKITGTNLDLVRIAKLVLDEYFSPGADEPYGDDIFEHIEPPPLLPQQGLDADDNNKGRRASTTDSSSREGGDVKDFIENRPKEKLSDVTASSEVLRRYSVEELIHFVDSPHSKQAPSDWARVMRDCPAILRKTPIEWLDGATMLLRRTMESDAAVSVTSAASSSPLSTEQE